MEQRLLFSVSRSAANIQQESVQIPACMKKLHIDARIPEECRYMCFLIVKDQTGQIRLQKLLGYGEQKLCIGQSGEDTTIGGVPGSVGEGTWTVIFGLFTEYVQQKLGEKTLDICIRVTDQDMDITEPMGKECWIEEGHGLKISEKKYDWNRVYARESRWYKGDFHTHTRLSDGKETVADAMKKAVDMEMDFYVPTEHNLMHTGWCDTGVCIVPGIEITTDKGHFNLFGLTDMPEKLLDMVTFNGQDVVDTYVEDTIKEASEKNWIVSINHPFLTVWKWRYAQTKLSDVQCLEIINDPTYQDAEPSNEKALRFIDALWNDGHKIYGVGGSDSHNLLEERYEGAQLPSVAGDPGTFVYCDGLAPSELMKAVRAGHMYVSRFCTIEPKILAGGESLLPGDEIPAKEEVIISYSAAVKGPETAPQIYLVINGDHIKLPVKETKAREYYAECDFCFEGSDWQWARLEVRSSDGKFLGYVNPVYYGKKEPEYLTFGELLQEMEEMAHG